ncbi:MAG TPA: hypothetical protein VMU38_10550 [Candidatus Binatia bacterium]|nr:hypothetical protein [Candidatus Binatia bacterium]
MLAVALLTGVLLCGRLAVAGAASIEELLAGGLTPSAAPALLGPITSAGRVGWECKPERAASSARSREADLPPDPGTQ